MLDFAISALLRAAGLAPLSWGVRPYTPALLQPRLPCRRAALIPPDARALAVFAFPYKTPAAFGGNVSCYAAVADYHRVCSALLQELCDALTRRWGGVSLPFVDASPFDEVGLAAACGLGVKGDNGLLITPRWGSYVFLGEIVTTLPLPPRTGPDGGECLHCGRCGQVCPGRCLDAGRVDAGRCLSAISQKKGARTPAEEALVARSPLLWGCDGCQLACPLNSGAEDTFLTPFVKDCRARVSRGEIRPLCKTRAFGFRGPRPLERNWELQHPGGESGSN